MPHGNILVVAEEYYSILLERYLFILFTLISPDITDKIIKKIPIKSFKATPEEIIRTNPNKFIKDTLEETLDESLKEEVKFIASQFTMLDELDEDDTLLISDGLEEDIPLGIISKSYTFYQFNKFLNNMIDAAKTSERKVILFLYKFNEYILYDFINNNTSICFLSIHAEKLKQDFKTLKDDFFYYHINRAVNLTFIAITCIDMSFTESDIGLISKNISSKINKERCLLISLNYALSGVSTFKNITFIKNTNSDTVNILRGGVNININASDFQLMLENQAAFGMPLIYDGLMSQKVGKFDENNDEKNLLAPLKINSEVNFDNWRLIDYAIRYNNILVIRFLNLQNFNLERQNDNRERALEVAVRYAHDVHTWMALLDVPYPMPEKHILLSPEKNKLLTLTNINGYTPLLCAADEGNHVGLNFLIQCGADIYFQSGSGTSKKNAIDLAWGKKHFDCVLTLLEADSFFPQNFTLDDIPESEISKKLHELIKLREEFHILVSKGDLSRVIDFIQKKQNKSSKLCLNTQNESVLYTALTKEKYEIYAYLKSKGFRLNTNENTFSELLPKDKQIKFKNAMIPYFNKSNLSCVLYLLSKSRILQDNDQFFDDIKLIYEKLSAIPEILIMLRVIECYPGKLDIIFDFDKDSVIDMDFTGKKATAGSCDYKTGRIYIGAKVDLKELLGTLAHELTHLAMQICYKNACFPYIESELSQKESFTRIRETIRAASNLDDIIKRVFTVYKKEEDWNAELIVRIPHMLAKYGREEGLKLLNSQIETQSLLEFYNAHVVPACEAFIKANNLANPNLEIRNDDLRRERTVPWKFFAATAIVLGGGAVILRNKDQICEKISECKLM